MLKKPSLLPLFMGALLASCSDIKMRQIIFTNDAPAPVGPYSQAIRDHDVLYVSGQIGLTQLGALDSSSIENEARQALNNCKIIVEAAGYSLEQVSKVSLFLTDMSNFPKVNEVYRTFFPTGPPARETIGVQRLPKGAHIEISLIASQ